MLNLAFSIRSDSYLKTPTKSRFCQIGQIGGQAKEEISLSLFLQTK